MEQKGFKIPEDYFSQKKADLRSITESHTAAQKKDHYPWHWFAAAAVIALAVFLFPFESTETDESWEFSDLQEAEIIEFLSEDPHAVYPESFVSFQLEDSLSNDEDLDAELIENYLNEHTIDYL